MKVIIAEDELMARKRLKRMLSEIDTSIEIIKEVDSILDLSNALEEKHPDLLFLDIQLADGICFELFDTLNVDAPIIFTTAFNDYMQKAFKVNSVDYLLKPIRPIDLKQALDKFKRLKNSNLDDTILNSIFQEYLSKSNAYKARFLVKSGRYFTSISTQDIAYIMAQNKLNYLIDHAGKKYLIDQNLDQIQKQLNPHEFIKINRNYIVSFKSIEKFESYFNNRLLLTLKPQPSEDVLVNRSYLSSFRSWVDR